ncbi:MAG: CoB--CoM heterodisulfide reductase iron-sulfur subunit A family protein [Candidatus Aminicenantes bacterium]|nr:CoB--CoM heterodisulfide reductase iron-sulfur subunit A family protein [Candidatus Aminicenantes bacterium]
MNERIGVYVCECGPNIPDRIDIDKVLEEISSIDNVAVAKRFGLLCSNDGKKYLEEEIKQENLSHLVVAACSPRDHEKTFMGVCQRAGLNPYLFQIVNIREQCAWMISDKAEATRMAIKYIKAGISRVALHDPLVKKELEANPNVLVIGGGISGMEAALSLAGVNRKVYLVEKSESLGGMANKLSQLLPHQGTNLSAIQEKVEKIQSNENIEVYTGHEIEDVRGFLGNFEVTIQDTSQNDSTTGVLVGAVVVATGFDLWGAQNMAAYGYGEIDNVVTSLEFEKMISSGEIKLKEGKTPQSIALIHCVGRKEKGYCSKVCCLYSIKIADQIKEKLSGVNVHEFYTDLCLPEKNDQDYFEAVKEKGVHFIWSDEVNIKKKDGKILVEYKTSNQKKESVEVDMAVLAPAMVPSEGSIRLAEILNIPLDETGFFKETHSMLDPVSTPIEGVYIVGCASGPKNIPESIVQAQAASGKILSSLIPGKKLEPEVKVSQINEKFCTGCQTCLSVCCYGAISFDEFKGVSVVNEAICRGCGSCVGSCPSGAIFSKHFTYTQLYQEVLEALH